MDLQDTPELADFRQRARDWLDANAPRRTDNLHMGMEGEQAFLEAKAWYRRKAAAGYASITWPKEYGGAGLSSVHDVIWSQEVADYETRDGYFVIGIGNCGPAIMHYAGEETKLALLPRMASAEDVWCQLFSEPSAGSDVAGLRTRARTWWPCWERWGSKF